MFRQGPFHTDGYRWEFQHQNVGKRSQYTSKPRGNLTEFSLSDPKDPANLSYPLNRDRSTHL